MSVSNNRVKFNTKMKNKLVISYEITRACNLRCPYCYAKDYLTKKDNYDEKIAKLVCKRIQEFLDEDPKNRIELDILGGDPLHSSHIFEFLDMVLPIGIDVWIVTNMVPDDYSKIDKLKQYMYKFDNLNIASTWHDSCDFEQFKYNMLELKEFNTMKALSKVEEIYLPRIIISFILQESETLKEKYEWVINNNISYGVTHLFKGGTEYYGMANRVYDEYTGLLLEVFENSLDYKDFTFEFGDEILSTQQFEERKLYNISHQYNLICTPINYHIDFFGNVSTSCPVSPSIKYSLVENPLKLNKTWCRDTYCQCSIGAYKEIINKRK